MRYIVSILTSLLFSINVFSDTYTPLNTNTEMGFGSDQGSLHNALEEGVDLATLQPYVTHEDINLKGEGPEISVKRIYTAGALNNGYFGNWDLSGMKVVIPVGGYYGQSYTATAIAWHTEGSPTVEATTRNVCSELVVNNLGSEPYFITDNKKSDLLVNSSGKIISENEKWKFECLTGSGEFGLQLKATSLNGIEVLFDAKTIEYSTVQSRFVSHDGGIRFDILEYSNLTFLPVSITDKLGRNLIYNYISSISEGSSNLQYVNGLCRNCVFHVDRIDASDGRFVQFNWDKPAFLFPRIDSINYGVPGNERLVSYSYTPGTGSTYSNYLIGVDSNQIHWGYDYDYSGQPVLNQPESVSKEPSMPVYQRVSDNMRGVDSYSTANSYWQEPEGYEWEMYGPLKKIFSNTGYEVEYNYVQSKCSLETMHDGLFEEARIRGVTMHIVSDRTERHGNIEAKYNYYFNELGRTRYLDNRTCPIDKSTGVEYLLNNPSFDLGSKMYRTIEEFNGRLRYSYYDNEPESFRFGKKLAEEVFINGELQNYSVNTWQEINLGFGSMYQGGYRGADVYVKKGYTVLTQNETDKNITTYSYARDESLSLSSSMLLDNYANPSLISVLAKDIDLLVSSGRAAPILEYRYEYSYPSNYGFVLDKVTKKRIDGAISNSHIEFDKSYNSNFQLIKEIQNGILKTYLYDSYGNVEAIEIESSYSSQAEIYRIEYSDYHYGKAGRVTHPDGSYEIFTYSPFEELLYKKDRFGNETRWIYENGLLSSVLNLSELLSDVNYRYEFNTSHGYTLIESIQGSRQLFAKTTQFNGFNNPVDITVSDGSSNWSKKFEYNENGSVTFEGVISPVDSELAGVEYGYDLLGRIVNRGTRTTIGSYIEEETICYDSSCGNLNPLFASYGHFKIIRKRNGEVVYDFMANLDGEYVYEKHINPDNQNPLVLKYNYFANGLPSDITVEDGDLTKVVNMGFYPNTINLSFYDDYETPKLTYSYSILGDLEATSNVDDGGSYFQYKNYTNGVLDSVEYSNGIRENYVYDPITYRLKRKEIADYHHSFSYDSEGNIRAETFKYPDNSTYSLEYSYDSVGVVSQYILPNGTRVDVTHDAMLNVTGYTSNVIDLSIDYEAKGRVNNVWFNKNAGSIDYNYTDEYKYSGVEYSGRDGVKNILSSSYQNDTGAISALLNSQSSQSSEYLYDDHGRLNQQTWLGNSENGSSDFIENFRYNFFNDLRIAGLDLTEDQYFYESLLDNKSLKSFEGNNIGYDDNANINSFDGLILSFDSRNLLSRFSTDNKTYEYSYFADGLRAREVVYENGYIARDVREINSTVLGELLYTHDTVQDSQEELYFFEGKLMGKRTVCPDSDGDSINDCHEDALGLDKNFDNSSVDSDGDGISDVSEIIWGLNQNGADSDTDSDGLPDLIDPSPNSFNSDEDNDGISNTDELTTASDPFLNETDYDQDNLPYHLEVDLYGTDPTKADSDLDGLNDGLEILILRTNALKSDSDSDGLSDGDEVNIYNTVPTIADTDSDGLLDGSEVNSHNSNPLNVDTDSDGLSDWVEVYESNTNPSNADSDGDGLPDAYEISQASNPMINENQGDYDLDGVKNAVEINLGLSPYEDFSLDPNKSDYQIYIDRVVVPLIVTSTLL